MSDHEPQAVMSDRGWMFFDLLLKRYHPSDADSIITLLTSEEQKSCRIEFPPSQLSDWLSSSAQILSTLHPQWIVNVLKTFEEKRQATMLAALPEAICASTCQLGKWKEPTAHIRTEFAHPILQDLLRALQGTAYVPSSALPKGPLTPLLDVKPDELMQVIDGLGLRDLAEVVRGMIDKKFLHSIYSCLKPSEQKLLRAYIQQKERLKTPILVLKTWDGKPETLRAMFHERGLMRMAMALHGQQPGFLWHLMHRLSPSQAQRLQQQMQHRMPQAPVVALLVQQLLAVLEFFQRQAV